MRILLFVALNIGCLLSLRWSFRKTEPDPEEDEHPSDIFEI